MDAVLKSGLLYCHDNLLQELDAIDAQETMSCSRSARRVLAVTELHRICLGVVCPYSLVFF